MPPHMDSAAGSAVSTSSRRELPPGAELMQCLYDGSVPPGMPASRSIEEAIEVREAPWSS